MHVQVVLNAGAGRTPEIESHVEAIRDDIPAAGPLRRSGEIDDLVEFLRVASASREMWRLATTRRWPEV